eukprot:12655715-Ditylum_brightwellii.AAC.1
MDFGLSAPAVLDIASVSNILYALLYWQLAPAWPAGMGFALPTTIWLQHLHWHVLHVWGGGVSSCGVLSILSSSLSSLPSTYCRVRGWLATAAFSPSVDKLSLLLTSRFQRERTFLNANLFPPSV